MDGLSYWATCEQLQPTRKLRSLAEGSRCEVASFLAEFNDEEEVRVADDANSLPFQAEAWTACFAFIVDPAVVLEPLAEARSRTTYRPQWLKRQCTTQLFDIKVNARQLGYPALEKAVDAAMREVEAMAWQGR